jgi:oligoribonuclease
MLLWIDLETTGLNFYQDIPLEVGIILTDHDLKEIARFSTLCAVVGYNFEPQNEFVYQMHSDNGLLEDLGFAPVYSNYTKIDEEISAFLEEFNPQVDDLHPAGSSVWFDVRFCERYFPHTHAHFHHRHYDVSSVKMFKETLEGEYDKTPDAHRAIADLEIDIAWVKDFKKELITP